MAEENKYPLDYERRFGGVAKLYTKAGAERLKNAHVCVVGLGGVGSWAAEALARTAVGRITLVDLDNVAESNTNRQLQAMTGVYGKPKVDATAERIHAINPLCDCRKIEDFIEVETAESLLPEDAIILDCIDNVKVKAAMAAVCKKRKQYIVACGAAGGKTSAMNIIHEDLARTTGDPLLSRMRYDLRKKYGFPKLKAGKRIEKFGIPCVYTADPVKRPEGVCDVGAGLSCAGYGSSVVVTAALGLAAASVAINPLCDCRKIEDFIEVETAESLLPEDAIILDCIDNVKVKAAMAAVCKKRKQYIVACGAAGGKTSAMNIIHEDLARTTGDPLLSRMRYDLRKKYGFPKLKAGKRIEKFGIPCVYTADPVKRPEGVCDVGAGLSCAGYGSSVVVTAALGLAAASVAINHITGIDTK